MVFKNINKSATVRKTEKQFAGCREGFPQIRNEQGGKPFRQDKQHCKSRKVDTFASSEIDEYPYQSYSPSNERDSENQALQSCDGRLECERDDEEPTPVQSDSTAKVQEFPGRWNINVKSMGLNSWKSIAFSFL